MKLTHYLRQSWQEAKAKPLYTWLYITGVTLAVALTMIFTIYYYIRLAPIYPEVNRNETYYITQLRYKNIKEGWQNSWRAGKVVADEYKKIKNAEVVSIKTDGQYYSVAYEGNVMSVPGNGIDSNFFKIYEFELLAGRYFTQEEYDSSVPTFVITDYLAEKLMGLSPKDAVGKTINFSGEDYTVCGVVRRASQLCDESYQEIYFPMQEDNIDGINDGILGPVSAVLLVKDEQQLAKVKEELEQIRLRVNDMDAEFELDFGGQPTSHMRSVFENLYRYDDSGSFWWNVIKSNILVFVVLLLVPALNMSGMISGRMDARQAEIGIRKSFGATKGSLLWQIFTENLLYTLVGAVLGLIVSWLLLYYCTATIIYMLDPMITIGVHDFDPQVTPSMLFSPMIFLISIGIILIFNVLSAIIPAWWSLRHNIVESLNNNR